MISEVPFRSRKPVRLVGAGALVLVLVVSGCGPSTGELSGTVLQKGGTPLPGGTITFYPDEKGNPISATIQENGTYEVKNLPVGTVKIAVENAGLKPGGGGPVGGGFALKGMKPPAEALAKLKEAGKSVPTFERPKQPGKYVPISEELSRPETSGMTAKVEGGKQKLDLTLPK